MGQANYPRLLYIRYFRVSRFQAALEIGKGLHERPCTFARRRIDGLPRVEIPDETCEKALDSAHDLKREVHDVMPDTMCNTAQFVP